jgi:hypothetical protein
VMPKTYVHIVEVFRLPAEADVDSILDNLRTGLARTLLQHQLLAGSLEADQSTRQMTVQLPDKPAVMLYINDMRATEVFPSFEELRVTNVRAPG